MTKVYIRALLVALIVFSAIYSSAVAFTFYEPAAAHAGLGRLLLNLDVYLACVVAGYVAAAMLRRRGTAVGIAVGLLAAGLIALYHLVSGPATLIVDDWRFWLISVVLSGCGGLLWSVRHRARSRHGDSAP